MSIVFFFVAIVESSSLLVICGAATKQEQESAGALQALTTALRFNQHDNPDRSHEAMIRSSAVEAFGQRDVCTQETCHLINGHRYLK